MDDSGIHKPKLEMTDKEKIDCKVCKWLHKEERIREKREIMKE